VRSNKCTYHRDTEWRLPGDMPDMASDSGFANYSRCTDLEFHPVYYGQEIEPRKRGLDHAPAKSVFAGNSEFRRWSLNLKS
jgi:hypothetical protein